VVTGWFSEFADLAEAPKPGRVAYGSGPARFAGATYDPTSHYRAARVFEFFQEHELTPKRLAELSQHQIGLLARGFDALDLDPNVIRRDRSVPLEAVGGFLALHTPHAARIHAALNERGVWTDYRGDVLRLGPAPYVTDRQLRDALERIP
jgi:kynureninase